ncbi:MAG: protein NO VEIN domain-containing protein [Methylobacter sp.]
MKRKIALKRLSASDLTLFEHQYRETSGAKQKAINLDAAVFVSELFPALPTKIGINRDRVIVTLGLYGPGGAGIHSITRKILKQQKNWRLNGELIVNPPEEDERYNSLTKGDYAILDFAGDSEPHAIRMYLVAKALSSDATLHAMLDEKYGAEFSSRKGMLVVDPDELAQIITQLNLFIGHPALDFIDFDALEDAALGGQEGQNSLQKRRKARGVSRDELYRAKLGAEQVGRQGEELLKEWFEDEKLNGQIEDYVWESDINAIAPYDFAILDDGKVVRKIDAKSTAGSFSNPLHVSLSELYEMVKPEAAYDLYRVYSLNENTGMLRIAKDLAPFASKILSSLNSLPNGVAIDSISIKPDALPFGDEQIIDFSTNDNDISDGDEID